MNGGDEGRDTMTGWWFGTCFIFPYIGNNHPSGVETTNQMRIFFVRYACLRYHCTFEQLASEDVSPFIVLPGKRFQNRISLSDVSSTSSILVETTGWGPQDS